MTNDGEEKDIIRASVTSIANSWHPPKRCNIATAQEKALKSLAKDPSVTILPADKGRCVVAMNTSDYSDNIMEHLQDENTYKRITDKRRNPTASTEKELNKPLQEICTCTTEHSSDEEQLNNKQYYRLHSTDCTPASFYGLPKIHKPDVPLRPITSSIGTSTYELSKHLVAIISPLQNSRFSVKNSRVFAERIREQTMEPDEVFVSFDVTSLFTCLPTHLALRITSERLHQYPIHSVKGQTCLLIT